MRGTCRTGLLRRKACLFILARVGAGVVTAGRPRHLQQDATISRATPRRPLGQELTGFHGRGRALGLSIAIVLASVLQPLARSRNWLLRVCCGAVSQRQHILVSFQRFPATRHGLEHQRSPGRRSARNPGSGALCRPAQRRRRDVQDVEPIRNVQQLARNANRRWLARVGCLRGRSFPADSYTHVYSDGVGSASNCAAASDCSNWTGNPL